MTVSSQRTAQSLAWSAAESGSLAVISFGSLVVYSRLLTQGEFGLFSVVLAITDLLGILVTMLFHDALVQRLHVTDRHFDTAFTVTVGVSLALMAGCWGAAPLFQHIVGQPDAAGVLAAMGLMFPALALSATVVAQQRREFAFRSLAVRSLLGRVLGGVVGVGAAVAGAGVWSLVLQQVVSALVGSLVLWFSGAPTPRFRFGLVEFRQLIGFGAFSAGALFMSFSVKRLFTIFAGIGLGVATAGVLNLAFRVVDVLWAVAATAVSQVALPMLAGLQADPARMDRAYRGAVEFACLVLYPCFVGIALTAPEIVDTVFGHRWAPAAGPVVALSCLVLAQAPRLFVTPVLTALGRPRDVLAGVGAELALMLGFLLAVRLPGLGWAVALWVGCECAPIPVTAWMLRRATGTGVRKQFAGARTPLLAVLVMALGVASLRLALPPDLQAPVRLLAMVAVAAPLYVAAVLLFDRRLAARFAAFVHSAFRRVEC